MPLSSEKIITYLSEKLDNIKTEISTSTAEFLHSSDPVYSDYLRRKILRLEGAKNLIEDILEYIPETLD